MAKDTYMGYFDPDEREAMEQLARRRRRTLSDELMLAVENRLHAVAEALPEKESVSS